MADNKQNNKVRIKSAGYIDGDYRVILEDGSEIDCLNYLKIEKSVGDIGTIIIKGFLLEDKFKNKTK